MLTMYVSCWVIQSYIGFTSITKYYVIYIIIAKIEIWNLQSF